MGKKVVIPVRVSEEMAGQIDARRGGQSRSQWVVDSIVVAMLAADDPPPAKAEKKQPRDPDKCPHPRGRVIKGFCYRCGGPAT